VDKQINAHFKIIITKKLTGVLFAGVKRNVTQLSALPHAFMIGRLIRAIGTTKGEAKILKRKTLQCTTPSPLSK
jgi:hypothetical protein